LLLQASANAVSVEAHCSLKGVFIPDGAFTDSAGVEVESYTQVPPSREIELVSGAIDLQLNDDFDAGLWQASGLLAGLPRTGDGQIWRGGEPVFVDTDFVISFEAPLGDSVFSLKLSVDGRRVHQHFSDQHPPILPDGSPPPTGLGLMVNRIEVVNSEFPIKFEFIKETTQLSADATFASLVKTLAEQNQVSVFFEERVDSSVAISGDTAVVGAPDEWSRANGQRIFPHLVDSGAA